MFYAPAVSRLGGSSAAILRFRIWFAVLALAAIAALWAWKTQGLALDDFFITYRYAWNLDHGRGLVFNPGERVFGLTCPAFGLLLGLLGGTGAPIPALATWVWAAALVGVVALLLGDEGALPRAWALGAGVLAVSSAYVWKSQGSEATLALAMLLLAARWSAGRPVAAGALAGAAVFLRPESALAIALLVLLAWRERRVPPLRLASAAAVVMAVGGALCRLAFSTWLPLTLASKRSLAALDRSDARFWSDAAAAWARLEGPLALPLAVLGLAGLAVLVRSGGPAARFLALWALGLGGAYTLLDVPFFIWYTVPLAIALQAGAAALVADVLRAAGTLARPGLRRSARTAVVAAALLVAVPTLRADAQGFARVAEDPRLALYRTAGEWIRAHSGQDERVAYVEIGVLAYASDRALDDLLGLVTPRSLPFVARRDLEGAFLAAPATWVVHHDGRGRMRAVVRRAWFAPAYEEVLTLDSADGRGRLHVYRRRPGAALPPPRPPKGAAK